MEEQKAAINEFAIASLVIGLLSFLTVFGAEKAIAALVFGILAMRRIDKNASLKGKGLAWAGIALGVISLILITVLAIRYVPQLVRMQQQAATAK